MGYRERCRGGNGPAARNLRQKQNGAARTQPRWLKRTVLITLRPSSSWRSSWLPL